MSARLAVVGSPIGHSLSPALWKIFSDDAKLGVLGTAMEVPPTGLAAAVRAAASDGTRGWSVTLPHKVAIMPLLDDLDDTARRVGAVNAVVFENGRAMGHNTDAAGFLADLRRKGFEPKGRTAAVLGAGGAARAACAALKDAEASSIIVHARDAAKAKALASDFGAASADLSAVSSDLIVNATSAGLDGKTSPLSAASLRRVVFAYDLIYRPAVTPFLAQAKLAGAAGAANGLGMLVSQAARAWELWFGAPPSAAALVRAENDLMRGEAR